MISKDIMSFVRISFSSCEGIFIFQCLMFVHFPTFPDISRHFPTFGIAVFTVCCALRSFFLSWTTKAPAHQGIAWLMIFCMCSAAAEPTATKLGVQWRLLTVYHLELNKPFPPRFSESSEDIVKFQNPLVFWGCFFCDIPIKIVFIPPQRHIYADTRKSIFYKHALSESEQYIQEVYTRGSQPCGEKPGW